LPTNTGNASPQNLHLDPLQASWLLGRLFFGPGPWRRAGWVDFGPYDEGSVLSRAVHSVVSLAGIFKLDAQLQTLEKQQEEPQTAVAALSATAFMAGSALPELT